jgi:hypothetical protein
MAGRVRIMIAAGGVFAAVVAVSVGLELGRHGSGTVTPGSPGGAVIQTAEPTVIAGVNVITLTAPPRIVLVTPRSGMKLVPIQVKPVPGVCAAPAIPVGGTPPPCAQTTRH